MDNHKDLIHIDGVFKELRNGEEQEPAGAWMRMKDLLDREMPVGAAVRNSSFRRYFIPLIALLLLGGGGAAYYELNKKQAPADKQAGIPSAPSATYHHPLHKSEGDGTAMVSRGSTATAMPAGSHEKAHPGNASAAGRLQAALTRNNAAAGKQSSYANGAAGRRHDMQPAAATPGHQAAGRETASLDAAVRHTPAPAPGKVDKNGQQPIQETRNGNIAAKPFEEQRVIETLVPKGQPSAGSPAMQARPATAALNAAGTNDLKTVAGTLNNRKIVQAPDGNLYEEKRDTFKRIDLVEKTVAAAGNNRNTKKILDTVAVTRVERVSYVPLTPIEALAVRKLKVEASTGAKILPVASLNTRTTSREMVNLVPLSQYKVGSRRVDPGKFNQLIQNTSKGIANYFDGSHNFYMALLAGGNASFGNPTAFGMQFGIAGLYSLSERLTLAAELRYVSHYFSNYSIQDQSITFDNISSQQNSMGWLFTGSQQTATSRYKINSYGMLEFPLTLSYNLGRVSVFGGADLAYAFPIQWSKETSFNTVEVQQVRSQNQNPFINSAFKLNEQQDFSSRFGLGYVWGLNYDVSRKISLDARVSQILWDNNKGNTDAINRLFRVPTLQFSLGYYFGRKDKVVYIMDRK